MNATWMHWLDVIENKDGRLYTRLSIPMPCLIRVILLPSLFWSVKKRCVDICWIVIGGR
ncbi:MAG: hypothetical protein ACLU30_14160 [Odoribacter splanchnicus]